MDYLKPKFSMSLSVPLSDREYEIRVGSRCPKCEELRSECKCARRPEPEALELLRQLHDKR